MPAYGIIEKTEKIFPQKTQSALFQAVIGIRQLKQGLSRAGGEDMGCKFVKKMISL